jgi:hypothetical protein
LIDDLVASKTFSLDALEAVRQLKDKAVELERQLERRNQEVADLKETKLHLENKVREQRALVDAIDAREKAVIGRESQIHTVEMARAVSDARAATFEQAMKIVFAPNMVRNMVQGFGGGTRPDGSFHNTSENRTTAVVDGYAREGDPDASGSTTMPRSTI